MENRANFKLSPAGFRSKLSLDFEEIDRGDKER